MSNAQKERVYQLGDKAIVALIKECEGTIYQSFKTQCDAQEVLDVIKTTFLEVDENTGLTSINEVDVEKDEKGSFQFKLSKHQDNWLILFAEFINQDEDIMTKRTQLANDAFLAFIRMIINRKPNQGRQEESIQPSTRLG